MHRFNTLLALSILTLICQTSIFQAQAETVANSIVRDGKCWIGSFSFTQGATARASDQVMICGQNGEWTKYDGNASVCILGSDLFGTGAVEIPDAKAGIVLQCLPDGTWEQRKSG